MKELYVTWYDSIREIKIIARKTTGKEWTELIELIEKTCKEFEQCAEDPGS